MQWHRVITTKINVLAKHASVHEHVGLTAPGLVPRTPPCTSQWKTADSELGQNPRACAEEFPYASQIL